MPEYQTDVTIDCECGEDLLIAEGHSRMHCECGAVFTVTITQLRQSEVAAPDRRSV